MIRVFSSVSERCKKTLTYFYRDADLTWTAMKITEFWLVMHHDNDD